MASPRIPDNPFRFQDLPKELRLMVYERLPRTIDNRTVNISYENWRPHFQQPMSFLTLIHRSTTTSILRVSKDIYAEAAPSIHKTIRNFILEASPKVAGTLHPDYFADVLGSLMRAAARDYDHLRNMFGFSKDGKPTKFIPSSKQPFRGCSDLATRYSDYDQLRGFRQNTAPGFFMDYTSKNNTWLFLEYLAKARETQAEWDIEDLPEQTLNGPALFLPGSIKTHVSSILHQNADEGSKRVIRMFITTASIQLLYHHITRTSYPVLGNPSIQFVYCFPAYEIMMQYIEASTCGDLCMRRMMHAFHVEGHRSICYDFGVHVRLEGYVVVEEDQQPILQENAIMKLPVQGPNSIVQGWERHESPIDGIGSVAICRQPMSQKEWADEWLANGSDDEGYLSL